MRDSISTEEAVQYCGRIASVHVGDSISTMEALLSTAEGASVLGGKASVLWRLFSTVEDSISTVEVIQYCGRMHQ